MNEPILFNIRIKDTHIDIHSILYIYIVYLVFRIKLLFVPHLSALIRRGYQFIDNYKVESINLHYILRISIRNALKINKTKLEILGVIGREGSEYVFKIQLRAGFNRTYGQGPNFLNLKYIFFCIDIFCMQIIFQLTFHNSMCINLIFVKQ